MRVNLNLSHTHKHVNNIQKININLFKCIPALEQGEKFNDYTKSKIEIDFFST